MDTWVTKNMKAARMADQALRREVKEGKARCNCGGPQYGTDHSPDCSLLLRWDELKSIAKDEIGSN